METRPSIRNKPLVQHNLLTTARYEMSAAEKDIVYMLLAQLEKDDPVDRLYHIHVKDIEKLTSKEISYSQISKATMRLISRVYTIKEKEDNEILQVSIISSARYITGSGKIAIRVDPEIRPYLFGLKSGFTRYGFFMAMSLKSKYSKRIYEMLSQFKNTGIMRISVKELKERLYLLDPHSGEEKYTIWTMFNKKVLEVAQRELSKCTDISFSYEIKKTGRTFTDLEFKISYNPQQLALQFGENSIDTNIYKRLIEKFNLSPWQANLVIAHVPEQEINKTLYEIQLKKSNSGLNNVGGFTAQTFENKYQLGLLGQSSSNANLVQPIKPQIQEKKQNNSYKKPFEKASSDNIRSIGEHMNHILKKGM